MRLVQARPPGGPWRPGVLLDDARVAPLPGYPSLQAWLEAPPAARRRAVQDADPAAATPLAALELGPVLARPPLLIDMGLSPAHLRASARTLLRHELPWPLSWAAAAVVGRATARVAPPYRYYKGNPAAVLGPGRPGGWPTWSSYVDIEPELAFVVGAGDDQPELAAYTIWNDLSARDVQLPEMLGTGPARSKDFADSNALGPCLVLPEALPDPLALDVEVDVGGRLRWRGTTADYAATPAQALADLLAVCPLPPGTVVGMGTVPGCTGLDHDRWPLPGEPTRIRFAGIGTLEGAMGEPRGPLQPSRWRERPELARWRHPAPDRGR